MPPLLILNISSFWFKVGDPKRFLLFEHSGHLLDYWLNFNAVVSQGTGRLKERKRDEGTHTLLISFAVWYEQSLWHPKTTIIVRSKITDHRSNHESTVIRYSTDMIMKKFEILQELPKCETETQNEQMLLEEWRQ